MGEDSDEIPRVCLLIWQAHTAILQRVYIMPPPFISAGAYYLARLLALCPHVLITLGASCLPSLPVCAPKIFSWERFFIHHQYAERRRTLFTGIVEEIGVVTRIWRTGQSYNMTLRAKTVLEDARLGDSIAVNGVCLTVTHLTPETFTVGLSPETRARTNLVYLKEGGRVNLERSLTPTSRMGGHFVQGHIDGVGAIASFRPDQDALWLTVQADPALLRYIVPKGFVALDGVSLTVVDVFADSFTVTLVAYTQQHITLPEHQAGYKVNIETDVLGKYVEKIISQQLNQSTAISLEFLAQHGYQ
jgi:riboflavin synthase